MSNSPSQVFPSTKSEILTMLYLKNQDLTNISPESLAEKYLNAYNTINNVFKNYKPKNNTGSLSTAEKFEILNQIPEDIDNDKSNSSL